MYLNQLFKYIFINIMDPLTEKNISKNQLAEQIKNIELKGHWRMCRMRESSW